MTNITTSSTAVISTGPYLGLISGPRTTSMTSRARDVGAGSGGDSHHATA